MFGKIQLIEIRKENEFMKNRYKITFGKGQSIHAIG